MKLQTLVQNRVPTLLPCTFYFVTLNVSLIDLSVAARLADLRTARLVPARPLSCT